MQFYKGQIKQLQEQVLKKQHLQVILEELQIQKADLEEKVNLLKEQKIEEDRDVERLERGSLSGFLYSVIGKKEEKLDKEKREAYAATVKYDAAVQELEAVEFQIQRNENAVQLLQGCEERYQEELKEKTELLLNCHGKEAEQILLMEEKMSRITSQVKELSEAITAGKQALDSANRVKKHLGSADGWATWDVIGGGILADIGKYDAIDHAKQEISELQYLLRGFKTELADVKIEMDVKVEIGEFLYLTDMFFDNFFADWAVADKISNARKQIDKTIQQIENTLDRLEEMMKDSEEAYNNEKEKRETFIVGA